MTVVVGALLLALLIVVPEIAQRLYWSPPPGAPRLRWTWREVFRGEPRGLDLAERADYVAATLFGTEVSAGLLAALTLGVGITQSGRQPACTFVLALATLAQTYAAFRLWQRLNLLRVELG